MKKIIKGSFSRGEFIRITIEHDNDTEEMDLPYFEEGTMYKGMEVAKEYTLEELGL